MKSFNLFTLTTSSTSPPAFTFALAGVILTVASCFGRIVSVTGVEGWAIRLANLRFCSAVLALDGAKPRKTMLYVPGGVPERISSVMLPSLFPAATFVGFMPMLGGRTMGCTWTCAFGSSVSRSSFSGMVTRVPGAAATSSRPAISRNGALSRTASTSDWSSRLIVGNCGANTGQVIVAGRASRTTVRPLIVAVPFTRISPVQSGASGMAERTNAACFMPGPRTCGLHATPCGRPSAVSVISPFQPSCRHANTV